MWPGSSESPWRFAGRRMPFFLPSVADPERAELLACKQAVILARTTHDHKVQLETDCLGVVVKLLSNEKDRSTHGPLVEEIKELLQGFADYSVRHTRRSCNGVAHLLAKEDCGNKLSRS